MEFEYQKSFFLQDSAMHSENLEDREVFRVLLIVYRNNYIEANLNSFWTIINSRKSQVKDFLQTRSYPLDWKRFFRER